MNEIRYSVEVTRKGERLFSCVLTCAGKDPNYIPHAELQKIAAPLAPCDVKCRCLSAGWYAERRFS